MEIMKAIWALKAMATVMVVPMIQRVLLSGMGSSSHSSHLQGTTDPVNDDGRSRQPAGAG